MKFIVTDVLVVGGGMAGIIAALTALEMGKKVIIIEKGSRYGGSMALSNGLVWTFSSFDQVRKYIPEGNPALQELLVENFSKDIEWLKTLGVEFTPNIPYLGYGTGVRMAPSQLLEVLLTHIDRLGGHRRTSVGMQNLRISAGKVCGVMAYSEDGVIEISADQVILATGGFQGNSELVARYISPNSESMYLRSNPWSTGDGMLAAQQAGAALTPLLDSFYGHAVNAPPAKFNQFEFQEMSHKYGQLAVALNLAGERFVDESCGTGEEFLNRYVAQQTEATAIYIFDSHIARMPYEGGALAKVVAERAVTAGTPVIQADDLESLTQSMEAWGVPARRALNTLAAYNAAVNDTAAMTSLRPGRKRHTHPISKAPYTAILLRAGITFTCGGLSVDMDMRVLRRSMTMSTLPLVKAENSELLITSIEGLYAAGSDVGGFSGYGYMGGLSQALVTGRIAGWGG